MSVNSIANGLTTVKKQSKVDFEQAKTDVQNIFDEAKKTDEAQKTSNSNTSNNTNSNDEKDKDNDAAKEVAQGLGLKESDSNYDSKVDIIQTALDEIAQTNDQAKLKEQLEIIASAAGVSKDEVFLYFQQLLAQNGEA